MISEGRPDDLFRLIVVCLELYSKCLMCETRKEGNVRRGSGPERTGESRDKREAHCCRTERVEFCPFAAVRSSRN